jgi:hypothetical protein
MVTTLGNVSRRAPMILALCLGLAACLGPQRLDEPLSPVVLRRELVGRPIVADEGRQHVMIRLSRNGLAARSGAIAEYGRWRIDGAGGLCLWWHDEGERCAPVFHTIGQHYRWGDRELSVLGR